MVTVGLEVLKVMALLVELPFTVTGNVPHSLRPEVHTVMVVLPPVRPYRVSVLPDRLVDTTLGLVFDET